MTSHHHRQHHHQRPTGLLPADRPVRLPERVYRRRRMMVAVASAAIAVVGVGAFDVLAGGGGVPASATNRQPAREQQVVAAHAGDTMWSLAERHRGDTGLREYVDTMVDINGGAGLMPGQRVILP